MHFWLLIALCIVVAAIGWWLLPAGRRARAYMRDVSTCGFLPPPPTAKARAILRRAGYAGVFCHVGRVSVSGWENLDVNGGSVLTAPNHSHPIDNFLMPYLLNSRPQGGKLVPHLTGVPVRFMAAQGWMRMGFGLGALLSGPLGAFCVDTNPGMGRPAYDAAIEVLSTGQSVNVFPEGGAYPDGVVREFKTGAVRLVKETAMRTGREAYIVPTYIRYGRYAPAWIMNLPEALRYLVILSSPLYFRRGVTVVFGKAIVASELPDDIHEATLVLRRRILALDPARTAD